MVPLLKPSICPNGVYQVGISYTLCTVNSEGKSRWGVEALRTFVAHRFFNYTKIRKTQFDKNARTSDAGVDACPPSHGSRVGVLVGEG